MITVLHVFNELPGEGQEKHLEYWYGSVRPEHEDDEDPEEPIVCWCGGRQIRIGQHVACVWHQGFWPMLYKAKEIQND